MPHARRKALDEYHSPTTPQKLRNLTYNTRMRTLGVSALLFVSILVLQPHTAQAADAGCHPITEQERAALKAVGADIPASGQFCDKDKELLYGACTESPQLYLETKRTGSNVDVAHLNSDFACRLSKFLKAADAAGMNIRIASGFRSIQQQAGLYEKYKREGGAPVAPPGRSRHNYGIAVDLHFDGKWPNYGLGNANTTRCVQTLPSCKWAHDNSAAYGLRWPMLVEPWHVEPGTAVKGMQQLPSDPNYWSSDSGTNYSGAPLNSYQALPQPAIVNSLPTTLPTSPTPSTQNPQQSQPQICNPSYSCTGGTMYYQTTSCTTQVYQVCAYGCDGNSCKVSSSTASISSTLTNLFSPATTSTSTSDSNTNENTNTVSVSDILNSLANPITFTSTDVGTSVPLVLNGDTNQLGGLGPNVPRNDIASSTITSVQPLNSQSTFTSNDLGSSFGGYTAQQSYSPIFTALTNMKNALLGVLEYLRRFGSSQ